jgi:hypothetical protein
VADDFAARIRKLPVYMEALEQCPAVNVRERHAIPEVPAIYALIEGLEPCYVGRSGPNQKLRKRIENHQRPSFQAASYAYKRTCLELGLGRSYRRGSGHTRAERRANPQFVAAFDRHRAMVAQMTVKFVRIDDPIYQYLFELYATMRFGLDLSGFETH